jgi:hypothetical protein
LCEDALMAKDVCSVRYVHKISPSAKDVGPDVEIPQNAFSNRNTLAKALRNAGVLTSGIRLRSFRVEGDKVVAFPMGRFNTWHSVILTCERK